MIYVFSHRNGSALVYRKRGRVIGWHWIWPMVLATALLLFGLAKLDGQSAKVISLSAADAAEAKGLHAALKTAEGAWRAFQQRIERQYLTTREREKSGDVGWYDPSAPRFGSVSTHKCETRLLRVVGTDDEYDSQLCVEWRKAHPPEPQPPPRYKLRGFEDGFEFSEDFRFAVPAAKASPPACSPWRFGPYDNIVPLGDTGLRVWR